MAKVALDMAVTRLILPFPPSVNGLYDGGHNSPRRFKSDAYRAWLERAGWAIKNQERYRHKGKVRVTYSLKPPDRRARDLGNFEKAPSDFLVQHGILRDDSDIVELHMKWVAHQDAECEVVIEDVIA